jgi:BirA family biotin operon repressor/biotin-[acetyl-CoA-carboxylase] ligase
MIGREVERLTRVTSTMDVVDERARAGAVEGLIVVADEQTAGRGRAGRHWEAAPGSALLCSILLRPSISPNRLGPLPLLFGVAVAETVEAFISSPAQLKWPNDVLIGGRKVAGILVQSRLSGNGVNFLNVGMGINVNAPAASLPDGATSLQTAMGRTIDRDEVLGVLTQRLDSAYSTYLSSGGKPSLDEWRRRALMLGEEVVVHHDSDQVQGRFVGIDEDGRLILQAGSGERFALAHGDVSRGPRRSGDAHSTSM